MSWKKITLLIITLGLFIKYPIFTIGIVLSSWSIYEWKINRNLKVKSKKPAVILSIGIVLAISAIFSTNEEDINKINESTKGISEKNTAIEEQIEQTFTPKMQIKSEVVDNKLRVHGETNLPEGTSLLITMRDSNDKDLKSTVVVKSGKFILIPIEIEKLKSGDQEISVSLENEQPDAVIDVIGVDGKLLSGTLINEEKRLVVTKNINVPAERSPPSDVKGEKVKVTRVIDGDTIEVNLNGKVEKVRLILVDTPETKHPRMGVQPFGPEASEFTTKSLDGKTVTLELGTQERDKYGRLLAYVWIGDKLFNKTLLEKGLARVAVYPPNTKYLDEFNAVQGKAKKQAIGIWSIENYAQENGFKDNTNNKATTASKPKNNNTNQNVTKKQETPKSNVSFGNSNQQTQTQQTPKNQNTQPVPKQNNKNCEGQIKGSQNGIYHVPGSTYYNRTTNVVEWFCTEQDAINAGYRAPKR